MSFVIDDIGTLLLKLHCGIDLCNTLPHHHSNVPSSNSYFPAPPNASINPLQKMFSSFTRLSQTQTLRKYSTTLIQNKTFNRAFPAYTIFGENVVLKISPKSPTFKEAGSEGIRVDKNGKMFIDFTPRVENVFKVSLLGKRSGGLGGVCCCIRRLFAWV